MGTVLNVSHALFQFLYVSSLERKFMDDRTLGPGMVGTQQPLEQHPLPRGEAVM